MNRLLTILLLAAGTAYGQIDNPPTSADIADATATGRSLLTTASAAAGRGVLGGSSFGGSIFTGTSASARPTLIASILGFSVTNNLGFDASLTNLWTATNAATAATAIGLGATNNVTFSNITASGTLAVTDNVTLSGVNNTMPNATNAASASSLMTRDLTDSNPLEAFSKVRPLLAFGSSTGTGSTATLNTYALGSADLRSGTNVSGYGRAQLYRGVNNPSHLVGSGINLSQNLALSFLTVFREEIRTNSAVRFIVGGAGSGAPAPANSNALTGCGFGIEIARTATTNVYPAASIRARLFAHDGTNYFTSDYTTDFAALNMEQFILNYTTNGTVSLRFSTATKAPARPSSTPVLTLTNGPVGSFTVGQYIEYVSVNASDVAPSGTTDCIYFGGMLEVKD